jgi:hypothetical protein
MTETGYVPPTPAAVRLMLSRTGLSLTEGAAVAGVEPRTLGRWLRGEVSSRGEVVAPREENWLKLVELCELQDRAADEAMAEIARQSAADPTMRGVSLVVAADDLDAKARGWPSHSAHVALIRRVAERCGVIGVPIEQITSGRLQDERTVRVTRAQIKPRAAAPAQAAPAKPAVKSAASSPAKPAAAKTTAAPPAAKGTLSLGARRPRA